MNPAYNLDVSGNTNVSGNLTTTGYVTSAGPYWRSTYTIGSVSEGSTVTVMPYVSSNDFSCNITIAGYCLQIPTEAYGIYSVTFVVDTDTYVPPGRVLIKVNQTTSTSNVTATNQPGTPVLSSEIYIYDGNNPDLNSVLVTGIINYSQNGLGQYLYFTIYSDANATFTSEPTFAYICVHKVA
jgi:hypothetical protein